MLDSALVRFTAGNSFGQFAQNPGHHILRPGGDSLDLLVVHDATSDQVTGNLINRIPRSPLGLFLLRPVAESASGEGPVLVEEAIHVGFDQSGSASTAHMLEGVLHGQVHSERVHAVDFPTCHAKSRAAGGQSRLSGDLGDVSRDGIQVVLNEEAQRQIPGCGEIERLERRSDIGRAVAEIGDRDIRCVGVLVGPGGTCCEWNTTADDRIGTDGAGFLPLQVHRATASVAETPVEPADLGHGCEQHGTDVGGELFAWIDAVGSNVSQDLGDELMMAPMGTIDGVGTRQWQHRPNRAALLTDAGMSRAVDVSFGSQFQRRLFEGPNENELAKHRGEQGGLGLIPIVFRRGNLDPRSLGGEVGSSSHRGRVA